VGIILEKIIEEEIGIIQIEIRGVENIRNSDRSLRKRRRIHML
jgi:hypothetical protein